MRAGAVINQLVKVAGIINSQHDGIVRKKARSKVGHRTLRSVVTRNSRLHRSVTFVEIPCPIKPTGGGVDEQHQKIHKAAAALDEVATDSPETVRELQGSLADDAVTHSVAVVVLKIVVGSPRQPAGGHETD